MAERGFVYIRAEVKFWFK